MQGTKLHLSKQLTKKEVHEPDIPNIREDFIRHGSSMSVATASTGKGSARSLFGQAKGVSPRRTAYKQ